MATFAVELLDLRKMPLTMPFVILLVTFVTSTKTCRCGGPSGVIVSALAYAWNNARRIHAEDLHHARRVKVYQYSGLLFFGSSEGSRAVQRQGDPSEVNRRFEDSRVVDQSASRRSETICRQNTKARQAYPIAPL